MWNIWTKEALPAQNKTSKVVLVFGWFLVLKLVKYIIHIEIGMKCIWGLKVNPYASIGIALVVFSQQPFCWTQTKPVQYFEHYLNDFVRPFSLLPLFLVYMDVCSTWCLFCSLNSQLQNTTFKCSVGTLRSHPTHALVGLPCGWFILGLNSPSFVRKVNTSAPLTREAFTSHWAYYCQTLLAT